MRPATPIAPRRAGPVLVAAAVLVGGCQLLGNGGAADNEEKADSAPVGPDAADDARGDHTNRADTRPTDTSRDGVDGTDAPENLLANPSFEQGSPGDGCPLKWTCESYDDSPGSFSVVDTAHTGEQAARWRRDTGTSTDGAVIKQSLPSKSGRRYQVDVWVRGDGSSSGDVYLQILFDAPGQKAKKTDRFTVAGSANSWTHLGGTTPKAPAGTTDVRFNLSIEDRAGTVRWDSASMARIDDSTGTGDTGVEGDGRTAADTTTRVTVGGGQPYVAHRRSEGETTYCKPTGTVVSNKSDLFNAFQNASAGDVIYVSPSATIDLSGTQDRRIPQGTTLASNRGCNGASGGLLSTNTHGWNLLDAEADVTIHGVRIHGPRTSWGKNSDVGAGVKVMGKGVEIANAEISGFSHYAIQTGYDTHIHHNNIHHNPQKGLGYGVSVVGGHPIIEFNRMNYNRHSVASGGGSGYTARYNTVGPDAISHIFDQHKPGGTTTRIRHNTVRAVQQSDDPKHAPAVTIRGVPSNVATIHHNWIYNPTPPCHSDSNWPGCAILQMHVTKWNQVTFQNNHFGSSAPGNCNIGAPRSGCPPP